MAQPSDDSRSAPQPEQREPEITPTEQPVFRETGLQRRRLIKGLVSAGAGLPVLLTLRSGAATARNSNTCMAEQTDTDDVHTGSGYERCTTQNVTETQIRKPRSQFTGWTGTVNPTDTTQPIQQNGMTGGSNTANDLCLVYYYPNGHASQGSPVSPANDTNMWGKNGSAVRMNLSCWNSLMAQ